MSDPQGPLNQDHLKTLLAECRQCGACCRRYRKVLLQPDEVDRIKALGGHVGVMVSLNALRDKTMDQLVEEAKGKDKIYMIHPDDKGCIFLQKVNGKYKCKIYHYRPEACRGFRCNLADSSMMDVFLEDPIHLLGLNRYGQKLEQGAAETE